MNRSTSLMTLGLVAAVSLFAVTAPAQNLLTNGNFATGSLTPWVPFTTPEGSNGGTRLPTVVLSSSPGGGVIYAAHFNVGEVTVNTWDQGGGINQIFIVNTAGAYNVSADIGSGARATNSDAGTFSIVIDGTMVASKSLGKIESNQFRVGKLSGTVSLAPGSHTFEVMITRRYLDDSETPQELVTNISLSLP